MSEFKRGQRVWAFTYGWGIVEEVDTDSCPDFPVAVKFGDDEFLNFTLDGRYTTDENRTLFFKEVPIPEDALVPPVEEIELQMGDIVALTDGRIVYVEGYSDKTRKVFFCHSKIPRNLEEAFGPTSVQKSLIRKVMGNLNA